MQHIMENWRKYNNEPFQLMLEQYDRKILTEKQLFETWQKDTLKELEQLNEIDWEKEAELTADPDYKPPQEREGMLAKGWEKVNDWILTKSIQIVDLAKRSAQAAIKSIVWLVRKISDLCKEYKTICQIAIMTLMVIAFYIAMAYLFENEAQAKIYRKGKPLSDDTVNILKGQLSDMIDVGIEDGTPGTDRGQKIMYELLSNIDEMHESKDKIEIFKSKENSTRLLNNLWEYASDYWNSKSDLGKSHSTEEKVSLIKRWMDVGKRVKAWYNEIVIDQPGYKFTNVDMGKTIEPLKKGAEEVVDIYQKTRIQR